ncbi:hypothetical protein P7K49_020724, partial [Saguinus oedipus]
HADTRINSSSENLATNCTGAPEACGQLVVQPETRPVPPPPRAPRPAPRTSSPPDGPLWLPQENVWLALLGAQAQEPPPGLRRRRLLAFLWPLHRDSHLRRPRKRPWRLQTPEAETRRPPHPAGPGPAARAHAPTRPRGPARTPAAPPPTGAAASPVAAQRSALASRAYPRPAPNPEPAAPPPLSTLRLPQLIRGAGPAASAPCDWLAAALTESDG